MKKLWNVKVTMIPILVEYLGRVPNKMELELGEWEITGRIGTFQTTVQAKSAGIIKRLQEIKVDLLSLRFQQ